MRTLLVLLVLVGMGYLGYRVFRSDDDAALELPEPAARAPQVTMQSAPTSGAGRPVPAIVESGEEARLRGRISAGAQADPDRIALARLLLAQGGGGAQEAAGLLRAVYRNAGPERLEAAALLLQSATPGESAERLALAGEILAAGSHAPGYPMACAVRGRELAAQREDSARVEAWELLSRAYFATEEPPWRDALRPDLEALAQDLLLSPRRSAAATTYKVRPGDTLIQIASAHRTTVEALRWLNGLQGDVIHPEQSLKVLSGTISIAVDKSDFRLDVLLDEKFLYSAQVGLGEFGKTPLGDFVIDVIQKHPAWTPIGRPPVPYGDPENPLGDYWLGFQRTEEYSGFGIHGTNDDSTIGLERSNGCIRLRNDEVAVVWRLTPRGTVVRVRE